MSMMKTTVAALGILLCSTAPVWAQDASADATQTDASNGVCGKFYHTTVDEAVSILQAKKGTADEKRTKLGTLFDKTVDTSWIGRFVLGRFWNGASADQQKEYLSLYTQYLNKVYVSKFDGEDLSDFSIKLVSINPLRSGDYDTKTVITRPGQPDVHVNYTLNESAGKCRVHDIIVENVSLLSSQRSEFQSLAGRSGIDGVMDALKSKINQAAQ